jgi:undecaprenyl-diphosphatase
VTGPSRAGLLAATGGSVAVLVVLAVAVSGQTFLTGETAVIQAVNDLPTALGWPLRVVMELGTLRMAVAVTAVVAGCTWRSHGPGPTVATLAAAVAAYRLDNVMKGIIERPRPPGLVDDLHVREHIGGFGFPSGHTTMAFALAAALHPILPNRWRGVAWALAACVGLARMHVGVHWPADVVGGAALGIAVASAAWLVVVLILPGPASRTGSPRR